MFSTSKLSVPPSSLQNKSPVDSIVYIKNRVVNMDSLMLTQLIHETTG